MLPLFGTRGMGQARRRRIETDGAVWHKGEWMEGSDAATQPASFLLEQPANVTLQSHFHRNNEFQVFVEGSGSIGPHALEPVMVHYAGAYTGYGPIVAGPQGLKYFTFRNAKEEGFIPITQRESMRRGPKRHAQSGAWSSFGPGAPALLERQDLIAEGEDGLAAYVLRLPRGAAPPAAPASSSHLGRFLVVLAGELQVANRTLGVWEHIYATHGEEPPEVRAGNSEAQVLCLQLPRLHPAYAP